MNVLSLFDGKYEVTSDGEVFSCVGKRKPLVGRVIEGKNKKTDHGVYFADLTLEGAL